MFQQNMTMMQGHAMMNAGLSRIFLQQEAQAQVQAGALTDGAAAVRELATMIDNRFNYMLSLFNDAESMFYVFLEFVCSICRLRFTLNADFNSPGARLRTEVINLLFSGFQHPTYPA
jgi:hypothetical protein